MNQLAPPPRPWERFYPPECVGGPIRTGLVTGLLDEAASAWAGRPAIDYRDRKIGFAALAEAADRLAAGLLALGLRPGERVALLLPNTLWHSVAFFAALKAGLTLVHLSPLDAPREIVFKLEDSGARTLITTDLAGMDDAAAKLLATGKIDRLLVGEDARWGGPAAPAPAGSAQIVSLSALLDGRAPGQYPAMREQDVALLQYTGGTTGAPKGAMLTHANLTAATRIYQSWRDGFSETGTQRVIAVLPMFHVYALGVILLLNIADGNEILLRPRFDVAATLDDIERKRATSFPAVPTMLIALLNEPGAAGRDFSSLQVVGSGGAPLPVEVGAKIERMVGSRLRTGWGMTETAAVGTRVPQGVPYRPGLIGVPLPGIDMRIVSLDDPARPLGPGERGEIAIRGPNVFGGYWNRPETANCFVDGWFLTGDIGSMDGSGLFSIADRKKRMIISGGFNVYPAMIENAIHEHPAVGEVIVIGVPDEYRGEAAKAFVALRAGANPFTLDELRAFLSDRLGRHELPAHLEIRESLPKSPVGKLLASVLIEEERARAGAA